MDSKKHNLGFTVLESTVVLLITAAILGTVFSLSNITKNFRKFQENIFIFENDLKFTLDLAIKGGELTINGNTSTLCGAGVLIDNTDNNYKKYYLIIYTTSSDSELIDCSELASSSPGNFNLTSMSPVNSIYISKNGNFTTSTNEALTKNLELVTEIKLATTTEVNFERASIVFTNPFGEPIVYYTISSSNFRLNFDENFKIIFIRSNEKATTTIFKTGKIISK